MKQIKENSIKYVKALVILYAVLNLTSKILYNILMGYIGLSLIDTIISYIPIILFAVYVFLYYKTGEKQKLLPLAYVATAVLQLLKILIFGLQNADISDIVALIVAVFLAIDAFTGFKRIKTSKKFVVLDAVVWLVFALAILIRSIGFLEYYLTYNNVIAFIVDCVQTVSGVFLMLAYIIFWNFCIDKKKTSTLENDLVYLRQQFDMGEITEQEYLKKKEEVLSKL